MGRRSVGAVFACTVVLAGGLCRGPFCVASQLRLTNDPEDSFTPDVAVGSDGSSHVVWKADSRVYYMRVGGDGTLIQDKRELYGTVPVAAPRIAVDSAGHAHVVCMAVGWPAFIYVEVDANGNKLYHKAVTVAFTHTVGTTDHQYNWPSVAMDPTTDLPVVIADHHFTLLGVPDYYFEQVTAVRLDGNGGSLGSEHMYSRHTAGTPEYQADFPDVTVDDNGRVHAAWTCRESDGKYRIRCRYWDEGGERTISDVPVDANSRVSMCSTDGRVHVAWTGTAGIYYTRLASAGLTEVNDTLVSSPGAAVSGAPDICGGKGIHVVWPDVRNGNRDVYYRALSCGEWQDEFQLTTNSAASFNPRVDAGADGLPWVVWQDAEYGNYEILRDSPYALLLGALTENDQVKTPETVWDFRAEVTDFTGRPVEGVPLLFMVTQAPADAWEYTFATDGVARAVEVLTTSDGTATARLWPDLGAAGARTNAVGEHYGTYRVRVESADGTILAPPLLEFSGVANYPPVFVGPVAGVRPTHVQSVYPGMKSYSAVAVADKDLLAGDYEDLKWSLFAPTGGKISVTMYDRDSAFEPGRVGRLFMVDVDDDTPVGWTETKTVSVKENGLAPSPVNMLSLVFNVKDGDEWRREAKKEPIGEILDRIGFVLQPIEILPEPPPGVIATLYELYGLPPGATFDVHVGQSGALEPVLRWTPAIGQGGVYSLTFRMQGVPASPMRALPRLSTTYEQEVRLTVLELPQDEPDSDGDGLVDVAELLLGSSTTDPDSDDDGMSDGAEYAADTDPINPTSRLAVTGISSESNGLWISWRGGVWATQFIERLADTTPTGKAWITVHTNFPPTHATTGVLDTTASHGVSFYRIKAKR